MFAALSRMRGLERLVLQMELQKSKGPVPTTLLPALKCLTLEVTISDARTLLARLALPAGVRVHLTLKLGFGSPRVWMPTLFPAMIACVDARAAPIARVAVRRALPSRHSPFVDVRAWRTGDTDSVPNLAVRLQGWEDIPSVLGSLPSTHLEALTMGRDAPDAAWLDALGNASKLHRVTVKGGAVTPFCAALERAPGVLPALSTLVIYVQVHLSAKTVLGDLLPRGLAARASAGKLLQELEVVGCDEDEACTRALQEAVPGLLVRWCWESEAEAEDEEEEDKDEDDGNISDFYDTSPGEESDSDSISEESQY
ncbi:hypothetical protein FA95DRAFT_1560371 [Auriscalpium vulgare]|uniref:Uncharacterized protein n=1 Tax=Auriscalpium vulgare TaxID=40419 RepID=A0ACB8RPV1_9AGAM|nr:hypothetical protein FA95DRAFT_1560371 [Auriscalpium vulgare]